MGARPNRCWHGKHTYKAHVKCNPLPETRATLRYLFWNDPLCLMQINLDCRYLVDYVIQRLSSIARPLFLSWSVYLVGYFVVPEAGGTNAKPSVYWPQTYSLWQHIAVSYTHTWCQYWFIWTVWKSDSPKLEGNHPIISKKTPTGRNICTKNV